jgi:integrase
MASIRGPIAMHARPNSREASHPEAGVSTNVFLRILHNRAVDLAWIVQPVILKKAWPKIRYGRRRGITFEEHQKILAVTPREDYRLFFELLWETGGAQTDIASLTAQDIDWEKRRLFYERQKGSGQPGNPWMSSE